MLPPAVWACSTRLSRPLEGLPLVVGGSCNRTATQSRVCGWRGLGLPSGCYPCFGLQARRMHQEGRTRKDMRTTHATARSKHQAARGAPPSLVLPRSDPELFDFCMREKTESTLPLLLFHLHADQTCKTPHALRILCTLGSGSNLKLNQPNCCAEAKRLVARAVGYKTYM